MLLYSICDMYRAGEGDQFAYERILKIIEQGYSRNEQAAQGPCKCASPCIPCSSENLFIVNERIINHFEKHRVMYKRDGCFG